MQKNRALVWVTDSGFLVPSIVAALQVSQDKSVTDIAEIYILVVGLESGLIKSLNDDFAIHSLIIIPLDEKLFTPRTGTKFYKTHIPVTAMGRFGIHYVLPPHIENIIYLDGDVQVLSSIFPLVNHTVKDGYICASPDFLWLCESNFGAFWKRHKRYLLNIGINNPQEYFNSGVMAFRRKTWADMAPKALNFFNENSEKCLYHDQSALNAIFYGKREPMSPLYNFGSLYADIGTAYHPSVKIAHFTGGNKPWSYNGRPWNGRFIHVYQDFIKKYEYLREFFNPIIIENEPKLISNEYIKIYRVFRKYIRSKKLKKYLQSKKFIF